MSATVIFHRLLSDFIVQFYHLGLEITTYLSPYMVINRWKSRDFFPSKPCDHFSWSISFCSLAFIPTGSEIEGTPLLASLVGGMLLEPRTRCAKASITMTTVSGFVIEGFHNYGVRAECFWNEKKPLGVLRDTISCLPEDKVRVMLGALHPVAILTLSEEGVDLFDTSYTYQVTERGGALSFPLSLQSPKAKADVMFEIDLKNSKYADQFIPLLEGCTCHTCSNFTRGYIHHLLNTKELLAGVLLSIHNIHHYLRFFEQLRRCLDEDSSAAYKQLLEEYCGPTPEYDTGRVSPSPSLSTG